jgi:hypothetical protein
MNIHGRAQQNHLTDLHCLLIFVEHKVNSSQRGLRGAQRMTSKDGSIARILDLSLLQCVSDVRLVSQITVVET